MIPTPTYRRLLGTSFLVAASAVIPATSAIARDTIIDQALTQIGEIDAIDITIGSRTETSSTVEWKDIEVTLPEENGRYVIDWITLEEDGDVSRVTLDETIDLHFGKPGDELSFHVEINSDALVYEMREDGGNVSQKFSAEKISVQSAEENHPMLKGLSMDLIDVSGAHIYPADNFMAGTGNMIAAAVAYGIDMVPEDGGDIKATATLDDLSVTYDYDYQGVEFGEQPPDLYAMNGQFSYEISKQTGEVNMTMPNGMGFAMDNSGGAATLDALMRDGQVSYAGRIDAIEYILGLPAMGINDAQIAMNAMEFAFAGPMAPSDEEGDIQLKLLMDSLKIDETLWGLVDPQAILPRDPATIDIDLAGKGSMLIDPNDPGSMAPGELPFKVSTAKINSLEISAAGAQITGEGEVDVNYDGPIPAPIGAIKLNAAGINGLMDNLMAMGLMQPEQAMPARMMLSMFSVSVGDDEIESTLEFTEDGGISANGQRIR